MDKAANVVNNTNYSIECFMPLNQGKMGDLLKKMATIVIIVENRGSLAKIPKEETLLGA